MSKNSKFKRDAKKNTERKKQNRKNDKIIRRKMLVPNIYFDESGNTGSNLLDPNQPVFSLASCSFSDNDARNLIGLLNSRSPLEAHFKNLKRRKNGQDAIIRFMSSKLINTKNIKISIFLKDFMITTKIVDILIEHMMYLTG